jgi:hypothetical protein
MITREEFEALAQKVERLEAAAARARNRGWMIGTAGVAALIAALAIVGGKPAMAAGWAVKAPFTIFGTNGRVLLNVQEGARGGILRLFDRSHHAIAEVAEIGDERGIHTFDALGVKATFAGVKDEGGGVLDRQFLVHDAHGDGVAELVRSESVAIGNLTGTVVFDDAGQIRAFTGIQPFDGDVGLSAFDSRGDEQLAVGSLASRGGRPGLALFGSDAQGKGLQALVESQLDTGGHIQLFDPAGASTFNAP